MFLYSGVGILSGVVQVFVVGSILLRIKTVLFAPLIKLVDGGRLERGVSAATITESVIALWVQSSATEHSWLSMRNLPLLHGALADELLVGTTGVTREITPTIGMWPFGVGDLGLLAPRLLAVLALRVRAVTRVGLDVVSDLALVTLLDAIKHCVIQGVGLSGLTRG